jgi:glycosyltransferase involved in cell wall biosynthesis
MPCSVAENLHNQEGNKKIMERVLVVGQTPPPVNGQTVMIQRFLDGEYEGLRLHHVRMKFSRSIDEVGTFQIRKLLLLLTTWTGIVAGRWKSRAEILYYPPAGPTLIPVIRDIILLLGTRWMFRYTVFHFHAAGLTEIYPRLPRILKPLYNLAYRKADLAIFTAKSRSTAGVQLGAKIVTAIPYGIPDDAQGWNPDRKRSDDDAPCILFMGILCEGKGLITLIEACSILKKKDVPFRVVCGGTWDAGTSREEVEALIESHGMTGAFSFPGVLWGESKSKAFKDADIFCFPSHYFAESSPVVLTEAMSFQLPIVTTNWRGIPDVVGDSGGAFVVEPKKPGLVAESLEKLLRDSELRAAMGKKSRAWFCEHGTIEKYRQNMELALLKMKTT